MNCSHCGIRDVTPRPGLVYVICAGCFDSIVQLATDRSHEVEARSEVLRAERERAKVSH